MQILEHIKIHCEQVMQRKQNQSNEGRPGVESNKRGIRKIPQNKKIRKGANER